MMTLDSLKAHAEAFIATEDAQFKGVWERFIGWAEGKQAAAEDDQKAIAMLESHGYTVTKA